MKEEFVSKKFSAEAQDLIEQCSEIMDAYEVQGFDLSLRQLYYQLVTRNAVPNTEESYKRVGSIVSDARLAGLLDWDHIVDRGRQCVENPHWESPGAIINSAAESFRMDLWHGQTRYVEVMVEKQALEGVLEPVCRDLDVPFTANKGYSSSSTMYEAGKRIARASRSTVHQDGRIPVVLYLGDHDPSGIDMTRDVEDRLNLFACREVMVHRLALNMEQVKKYDPPPNPAKLSDSRAKKYVEKFGRESWELDALEPKILADLVRKAVEALRDEKKYKAAKKKQDDYKAELRVLAKKYE